MKIRIISGNDVKKAVNMAETIKAVKDAYTQLSAGQAIVPQRSHITIKEQDAVSLFMPAYLSQSQSLAIKIVSVFPRNKEKELPTILAMVIALSAESGQPLAVIEGSYLTALRTGAASGVATDLLARREAEVAALFGAGVQTRTQIEAVLAVRPIRKIWIFDIYREKAEGLAEEIRKNYITEKTEVQIASSPAQAVQEADVICTATTSFRPVFDDASLKPGVHINGIGSYTPQMQEIPAKTVVRSKVVVDSFQACLAEAGDLIIPIEKGLLRKEDIYGEIGQITSGRLPGRQSDEEITFFKSVGIAVQDVAVAELVLSQSQKLRLGVEVKI
ncbi:MAG: ornithine cyclodeaminase family protein [Candidatus Aminicenantales bacterium]